MPMISGHRGANAIAPENTLASADSCAKYGIDYIECDLCISKDSVFYLLHDDKLDRTTNGVGEIADWMSQDIDTLDAGSWFGPEFKGQRVAKFADLLRVAKNAGIHVTVDYRAGDFGKMMELINAEGMLDSCSFTFYKEEKAKAFRAIFPEVSLQAYVRELGDFDRIAEELKPDIIVAWIEKITPEFVEKVHLRNMKMLALVLGLQDRTAENRRAVDLGVDIVASDRPEEFVKKYGHARE